MNFPITFVVNICILIALSYLALLTHKYWLRRLPSRWTAFFSVCGAILAGWISMYFGLRLDEHIIFDLRFVPLIIATLITRRPLSVLAISTGIAFARFTFGYSAASLAGFINVMILGVVCSALVVWFEHKHWSYTMKLVTALLIVNTVNTADIAVFGVLSYDDYLLHIAPATFPLSLLLSGLFAFIVRDVQLDQRRMKEIQVYNQKLKRQKRELQQAKQALEEYAHQLSVSSQYKTDFLANISHELRTPLNSVLLLSQLLQENDPPLPEESHKFAETIHASAEELLQMINDILDLAKVEAGKMDIADDVVNVSEIPQIMQMLFHPIAEQKGIAFAVVSEAGVPDIIYSDQLRIQQILKNLLSNAFKFTQMGTVKLHLYRRTIGDLQEKERIDGNGDEDGNGELLAFSISDTGIGISQEKHQLIFEAFQQADGAISRRFGGTGLGLSISRELAKLLGGYIEVESSEGAGSTFTLCLPLRMNSSDRNSKNAE